MAYERSTDSRSVLLIYFTSCGRGQKAERSSSVAARGKGSTAARQIVACHKIFFQRQKMWGWNSLPNFWEI